MYMTMSLFVGRIPCLLPSRPLINPTTTTTTTPLASSKTNPTHTQAPPPTPNPHSAVADLLVQSCGLSPGQALQAASSCNGSVRYPDRPHAVLHFLREIGVNESDIRAAVLRDARILRSSVEKNWGPNVAKLQDVGFSIDDISVIISRKPGLFAFNFVAKIDFWLPVLGSAKNLASVLRTHWSLLHCSLERVAVPRLTFLKEQLGLSDRQIVQLIKLDSRLITYSTEALMTKVTRAEELGVARSARTFVDALKVVSALSEILLDARLNNLKSLGFSEEEVTRLICRKPLLLRYKEELIGRKMEFLIKEVGCDISDLVRRPALLTYSLEGRLIPRDAVRKLLMSKGLLATDPSIAYLMSLTDDDFVKRFILPYEHAIPGLHQAYADGSVGKIGGID